MPLTAAEWLSENSERQELAVMNIPLAMEAYNAYRASFVSEDVEKAINEWIESNGFIPLRDEEQKMADRHNVVLKRGIEYGYSLAGVESVRFAEWILKTDFKKDEDICFRAYKGTGSHQFTVTELYSLFKKESNGK